MRTARPTLADSGTFISPVDAETGRPPLSQVVSEFEASGLGRRPYYALTSVGSSFLFKVDESAESQLERLSKIDPTLLRPTLLSPPPTPSNHASEQQLKVLLLFICALTVLLIIVIIAAII